MNRPFLRLWSSATRKAYSQAIKRFGPNSPIVKIALRAHSVAAYTEASFIRAEQRRAKKTKTLDGDRCFVCYLDIDGFEQKVLNNPEATYKDYSRIQSYMLATFFEPMIDNLNTGHLEISRDLDHLLWPYMFSDSWFVATKDDSEESLRQLSCVGAGLFARALEIGLPARGAIGVGEMWWHPLDGILLGPGIIQAARLAERIDCFGIAFHQDIVAVASAGIATESFEVPIRREKVTQRLRFARLHALPNAPGLVPSAYLGMFKGVVSAYQTLAEREQHIVDRYQRSEPIVRAMLCADG